MKKLLPPILFGIALFFVPLLIDENAYCINIDKIFHFFGGAIVAWFFANFISTAIWDSGNLECVFFLITRVCLVGIAWEILEYIAPDLRHVFFLFKFFQGGDMADTIGDLAFDMLGGFFFSTLYVLIKKRK